MEITDKEYLETIKEKINSNKPLYFLKPACFTSPQNGKSYKRNSSAILDITNKTFYEHAIKLGLIPNKKRQNISFPNIPSTFFKDFILGYFEGDGCLTWGRKSRCWDVCGCYNLCKDIQNIIQNELGITGHLIPYSSIYILRYQKIEDIIKMLHWIYKEASFVMKRKHNKSRLFLDEMKKKGYAIPII